MPNSNRHLPRVERSLSQIHEDLRAEIRRIITAEKPWPLVMIGKAGVGKTCAALCMLDYAGGEYYTVSGLCSLMIRSQQGRLQWDNCGRGGLLWPEKLWEIIADAKLVVLDEIGCRQTISDAHYEIVKQVIDERYCKPLVAISNLSMDQIGRVYDDRVASRLAHGTVITITVRDRRLYEE